MRAKRALEALGITRKTLNTYVKTGKIKVIALENGFYDYDDEDVTKLANAGVSRRRIVVFEPGTRMEITPEFQGYDDLIAHIVRVTAGRHGNQFLKR